MYKLHDYVFAICMLAGGAITTIGAVTQVFTALAVGLTLMLPGFVFYWLGGEEDELD